ncbi:choice-of-anchor J domain-containing protein [Nocardioides dubius]|uniref:Ig-like domain (Group 3) n=1 Tax=Nocardioides dubius TaxID=317019 RepID=A0ABP4EHV2_9ACTN
MSLPRRAQIRRALAATAAVAVCATGATALATTATASPATPSPTADAVGVDLAENFDAFPSPGWTVTNNSSPVGSISWFQGTATDATPTPGPFNSHQGANNSYAGVNFNSTGSTGTISNWLITPLITDLSAGDAWSFYTRKPTVGAGQTDYPDRLEVRMSTGGSCSPGSGASAVGDFSTLLVSVNPTQVAGGYPQAWTQFSGSIPLGAPTTGCLAFRYFVTGGGSLGTNSDYIGVDTFRYTHQSDPTVPDTALTNIARTGHGSVSATFTATPGYAIAGYECSLDGAPFAACTSPLHITGLSHGSHDLSVRARTHADIVDPTPAQQTFSVDTVAPDVTLSDAPSGTITSDATSVSFSADEEATFECRLDDGDWAACTSPASFTGLADGEHTVHVRGTDTSENIGTPASSTFTVDTTAPTVTLTDAPTGTLDVAHVALTFTSDDPAASYECRLDDGDWATCTSPASFTGLTDGAHTIAVRGTDPHANTGEPAVSAFTVAVPAPPSTAIPTLTKITLKAPASIRSGKKLTATIRGIVPGTKLTVRWAGKTKRISIAATSRSTTVKVKLKAPKVKKVKRTKLTVTATAGSKKVTATKKVKVKPKR